MSTAGTSGWTATGLAAACLVLSAGSGGAGEVHEGDGTMRERLEITVGTASGDIRGDDHRALQAAVDYVAGLGGGTVRIGPGRYTMRNALSLRDNVRVVGDPGRTILAAAGGVETPLRLDGDCNERKVTLVDPSGFRVGDGISVRDGRKGGFGVTTATLVAKVGTDAFAISRPLYYDYMVSNNAAARLVFPVVAGYQVKDASVEGITVEGNREKMPPLNGCRGAGIYLFECERIAITGCAVRDYNGDGISFQVSQEVTVEDCLCEGNAGIGIHPGSGSGRPVVRRSRSIENDGDGIFVCWRVKHGLFEDNLVRGIGSDPSWAPRPVDSSYDLSKAESFGICCRGVEEGLEAMRLDK